MLKCFEGENTSMCEAIRQMVDEGIMLGEKRGEERGEKRGEMQKTLAIARRMLEKNVKKVGGLFNDKKRNEIADSSWG